MADQLTIWILAGWYSVSVTALLVWLGRTRLGARALTGARRASRWAPLDVLLVVGVYVMIQCLAGYSSGRTRAPALPNASVEPNAWAGKDLASAPNAAAQPPTLPREPAGGLQSLAGLIAGQLCLAVVIAGLASGRYADGLRGLGLRKAGWVKTVVLAGAFFVVGAGLAFLTLDATLEICRWAGCTEVQQHLLLKRLAEWPPWGETALVVLTAVVGAPLSEELLFRGVLQTFLVSSLGAGRPMAVEPGSAAGGVGQSCGAGQTGGVAVTRRGQWAGVLITGGLFAVSHADWQHMPALLVLGVFLGYLYERYGNLLLVMLVHGLFNALPVVITLAGDLLPGT